MNNLEVWKKLNQPPTWALKQIRAGRLKGKSDINPQWRYYVLTETFGQCGTGWKFTIDKLWTEPGNGNEVFAFAMITLYTNTAGQWSAPIPGVGGSKLVQQESSGPHNNDEGYKMAITDALSTACKMLGVASDIYMGLWDGSKYMNMDDHPQNKAIYPTVQQTVEPPTTEQPVTPLKPINEPEQKTGPRNIDKLNATQKAKVKWLYEQKNMTEGEANALLNFYLGGYEPTKESVQKFIDGFGEVFETYMDSLKRKETK